MRKIYFLLVMIFVGNGVWGQVLTENFSYTAAQLITANGWTAHNAGGTNAITVTTPGLTYAGHPGSGVGNAITMTTSGEDDNRTLSSAITTGTAYASFLVNLTATQVTGDYFIGLYTSASSFPIRIFARTSGAGFVFGINKGGGATTYEATVRTFGVTYFVVTNYIYNGLAQDDVVNLWVNPTLGSPEPAATIPNITGLVADVVTITAFYVRQGNAANAPTQVVDAILVGTTWAQVTPLASGPTINVSPTTLTGFTALSGVPTAEQSYTVDGSNLTSDILITPPVGFEIATVTGGPYTVNPAFITLTQSGGNAGSTPIYVRMNSATLGTNTGNITHTSTGANNPNVGLTGHVITTEPSIQSTISFGTITPTSMVVNFAGGDGAKRVLLARLASAVDSDPVDGTTYTENPIFTSGTQVGVGNYVVYANTANSVTVTGLSPSSTYHFAVYEYNDAGIAGAENYLLTAPGTGNATTLSSDGDYRSVATGIWSDILIWQVRVADLWTAAGTPPIATSNVYIQTGHTVTVDVATAACNDLHLNTSTAILAMGANTVEVNGKLRAYTGAAVIALGADGTFYSAQASSNLVGSTCLSSTAGSGKMRIIGNSRIITYTGEWGNNPPLWDVEFAPNAGQTFTIQTGFKAQNITIVSGTVLSTNTDMRPDGGAGVGTLTVKTGSTLIFSNNNVAIQRIGTASATSHFGTFTVEPGAILEFSGTSNPIIGAGVFALNGTVIYSGAGNQNFATKGGNSGGVDPDTYNNVTLSTSGSKTSGAFTTTINGTLSLQGTAYLVAGATFGYGPTGVLEYKGSAAQATTGPSPSEWPIVNGPFGLTIDNVNGVTLSAPTGNRTINGALTLTNGIFTTTATSVLILDNAATVPTLPTNANFVSGPLTKIGSTNFVFPIGKTGTGYVPLEIANLSGSETFTAEYIRADALGLGTITAIGLNKVSRCEYWTLTRAGAATADVSLNWTSINNCSASPYITNLPSLTVAHFDGVNWDSYGVAGLTSGTTAAGKVSWLNVSVFSPFTIASTSFNPLAVNVNYLRGTKQGSNHLLNWKVTCNSTPSVTMTLERSASSTGGFTGINTITATAAQCAQPFNYTDAQPLKGMNYYRLKMVDATGKISYSTTVALLNATKGFELMNIAPNPITGNNFTLNVAAAKAGNMELVISDMQGRVVNKQTISLINGFNSITINVTNLGAGTYNLFGTTADDKSRVIRFVKQ